MLEVYLPFEKSKISQRFGENANTLYASQGLKGHPAYDWDVPYATQVPNCVPDAYCYSVLNRDNPDPQRYRAVCTLHETETDLVYEIIYGHLSGIFAQIGHTYQPGDVLGLVGNSGPVFSGGREVTKAEKLKGSRAGSHLHGPQIRVCKKVSQRKKNRKYLYDAQGLLRRNGFYYEVVNYDNGYNGCVSLKDFSTERLASTWQEGNIEVLITAAKDAVDGLPSIPEESRVPYIDKIKQLLLLIASFLGAKK